MLHALIIAIVGVIAIHDSFPAVFSPGRGETAPPFGSMLSVAVLIAALLSVFAHSAVWMSGRRLNRTGSMSAVRNAERATKIARIAAVVAYAWLVLAAGFLDSARAAMGDLVLVDEIVVITPTLLVFVLGWWSMFPIERRLHEAGLISMLDAGRPLSAMPSRLTFVLDRVRHDLLLLLAPIALILAWSEVVAIALEQPRTGFVRTTDDWRNVAAPWLQLLGAVVILLLAPLVIRMCWRTQPIGPGHIRNRLTALCERQGVKFRKILVWKTHGMMINGAVLGFWAPVRYVLLTDALLESLPEEQVEAVMAHEVGHVRRKHMPWLLASMVVGLGLASMVMTLFSEGVIWILRHYQVPVRPVATTLEIVTLLIAVIAGLLTFGWVSRRFERQADAFAVQHISGLTRQNEPGAGLICQPDAADAMAGALASVASLNHIPRRRWTWRHGSIAGRQHAIGILINQPVDALPIDRLCRKVKIAVLVGFVAMGTLGAITMLIQNAIR